MFVSVIIPAYNEEKNIPKLVKSIREQDEENYEIIIVDNNSKDNTFNVAKRIADKAYKCKEQGISPARNFGAKNAKGDILVFVDADCVVEKGWLKTIKEGFEDESISVMSGRILTDHRIWYKRKFANFTYLLGFFNMKVQTWLGVPAMMAPDIAIRKKVFDKVRGFDKVVTEDYFLTQKLKKIKGIRSRMDIRMKVTCSARRMEKGGILKMWYLWYKSSFKKVDSDNYKLHDKL